MIEFYESNCSINTSAIWDENEGVLILTRKEVQEALDLHLEQLNHGNALMEDQVCEVLRKMLQAFDKSEK
ncbi:MAG: hypothetical protein Q4A15_01115 [Prevotellaceae bacterium]|nr:hypothetical protein [Prevotellaceae bacterium]